MKTRINSRHYAKSKHAKRSHVVGTKRKKFPVTGCRFREARHACLLNVEGCADLLRVSERTIRGWESGATRIPYAAYKLMRVLRGGRYLAHSNWDHFHVRGPILSTPEGHELPAGDLAWLSLLVRRAQAFSNRHATRDAALTGSGDFEQLHGGAALRPQPLDSDPDPALALSPSHAPRLQSGIGHATPAGDRGSTQGSPPRQTGELQTPAIERSAGGHKGTPEPAPLSLTIPVRLKSGLPCKPRNTKRAAAMAVQS